MKIFKSVAILMAPLVLAVAFSTTSVASTVVKVAPTPHVDKSMIEILKKYAEIDSRSLVTDASRLFSINALHILNRRGFRFVENRSADGARIFELGANVRHGESGQRVTFFLNGDVVLSTYAKDPQSGLYEQTIHLEASKNLAGNIIKRHQL